MKLADMKPGMKLKGVGKYADKCIVPGGDYTVFEEEGFLFITCGCGHPHELDSTANENGDIPELEAVP